MMGFAGCHLTPLRHTGILTALANSGPLRCPGLSHCFLTMVGDPLSLSHTCPMFWTVNSHLGAELLSLPKWPGLCTCLTGILSQA